MVEDSAGRTRRFERTHGPLKMDETLFLHILLRGSLVIFAIASFARFVTPGYSAELEARRVPFGEYRSPERAFGGSVSGFVQQTYQRGS